MNTTHVTHVIVRRSPPLRWYVCAAGTVDETFEDGDPRGALKNVVADFASQKEAEEAYPDALCWNFYRGQP